MLIEAVGIGKGKQDLTGKATEPIKTNHVFSLRPEIPIGKACSSLSSADIIKYLRGDFRLSKARSSDLFWEAVWPRLLAKGWHSEQPKDHGVCGSKPSLVFLIPGVKKFSRRRLAKGNQYFDSVSDVLNKVASDPGLLELEIEAAESSEHKEDKWEPPEKQDFDGLSKKQRHCYLQPHNSNRNQNLMKFTIVDTSMVHGVYLFKLLVYLPALVFPVKLNKIHQKSQTLQQIRLRGKHLLTHQIVLVCLMPLIPPLQEWKIMKVQTQACLVTISRGIL